MTGYLLNLLSSNASLQFVQQRLDNGETPMEIYNSNNELLDSLYGKTYQGGLIFYFNTSTGTGLAAAPNDLGQAQWGCYGTLLSGSSGIAVGTGKQNTIDITSGCTDSNTAAKLCTDLVLSGFDDWFLPSKEELSLIYGYLHTKGIGNFTNNNYWSSSQVSNTHAWYVYFNSGGFHNYLKNANDLDVRPIRAF
jgi:hypothetical protein